MAYPRAIPNFRTEEGRTGYAHLIGLDSLPDYVHTENNGCYHEDKRIEDRERKAREVFRDLEKIRPIIQKYMDNSRKDFLSNTVKPHPKCSICKSNYVGSYNLCPICAHIFRSEKMVG